jgi:hypothetical protein
VLANEAELHSLYQTSDFDTAPTQLRVDAKLGIVTRSGRLDALAAAEVIQHIGARPQVAGIRRADERRFPPSLKLRRTGT